MKGQEMEVAEDMFEGVEELKTPSNTDTSVKNCCVRRCAVYAFSRVA